LTVSHAGLRRAARECKQLKQLHVTLLNLKVVTTYAKALVETLAEKPNRVIFSGKPAKLSHPRRKF
jgi:hypothetical protein